MKRWQHLRSGRRYAGRYYFGVNAAGKYARFAAGREGTQFCVYMTLMDEKPLGIKSAKADTNGAIEVPLKYNLPEVISIDKDIDSDTYRIMAATQWQIENELIHRNIGQPTGWYQKASVITVRKEDSEYLTSELTDGEHFYSREVYGERPSIVLIASGTNPGPEWKDRTKAIKKRAFGVSSRYAKYVGLTRNTQLQAIRTRIRVHGKEMPCYCFLAPDHNDAVTGRVINESLEPVIFLDVKKEADEQLSTVREYMSHTDEKSTFSARISQVLDMLQRDKAAVDALMETEEIKNLLGDNRRRTA